MDERGMTMFTWNSIQDLDADAEGYILVSDGTDLGVWIAELEFDFDGNMIFVEKQECVWLKDIKYWMPIPKINSL